MLDPPEVFTGLATVRAAAIRNLATVAWPPALAQTLQEVTLRSPNAVECFRLSMSYRAKRMLDL